MDRKSEFAYFPYVLRWAGRIIGAVIQFADDDAWNKNFDRCVKTSHNVLVPRQERDGDVGVEKNR